MTTQDGLVGKLKAFLLAGKVDGLDLSTLKNYQYHLRALVNFCSAAGVGRILGETAHTMKAATSDVTAQATSAIEEQGKEHPLQQHSKPISL